MGVNSRRHAGRVEPTRELLMCISVDVDDVNHCLRRLSLRRRCAETREVIAGPNVEICHVDSLLTPEDVAEPKTHICRTIIFFGPARSGRRGVRTAGCASRRPWRRSVAYRGRGTGPTFL